MTPCRQLLLVLLWGVSPATTHATTHANERPNVLLLMVDDLNDWVGPLGGHPQAITPHIDRLAARGVLFANAHAPAPLCNPSRTSMLTGLLPSTTGIYCNRGQFREHPEYANVVTIPQHFRQHGYATWSGGKVFHKAGGPRSDPASWDSQYSTRGGTASPAEAKRFQHGLKGRFSTWYFNEALDWGPIEQPKESTGDWQTADGAAQLLKRDHEQPFFLACGIFRPHLSHYAPREYFDALPEVEDIVCPPRLDTDLHDVPHFGQRLSRRDFLPIRKAERWPDAVRGYLACVAFADACVGHVLEALDEGPHRDNTIVVLAGDHGWHLGEKDHWSKFTLWERASKTPLIIAAPDADLPGSVRNDPASLVDVYPTLLGLSGLPKPNHLEGRDLSELIRDRDATQRDPVVVTHWRSNHAIQDVRYRYIRYRDGGEELYDHQADPHEWSNLAASPDHAAVKQRLKKSLPTADATHFQPESPDNL